MIGSECPIGGFEEGTDNEFGAIIKNSLSYFCILLLFLTSRIVQQACQFLSIYSILQIRCMTCFFTFIAASLDWHMLTGIYPIDRVRVNVPVPIPGLRIPRLRNDAIRRNKPAQPGSLILTRPIPALRGATSLLSVE